LDTVRLFRCQLAVHEGGHSLTRANVDGYFVWSAASAGVAASDAVVASGAPESTLQDVVDPGAQDRAHDKRMAFSASVSVWTGGWILSVWNGMKSVEMTWSKRSTGRVPPPMSRRVSDQTKSGNGPRRHVFFGKHSFRAASELWHLRHFTEMIASTSQGKNIPVPGGPASEQTSGGGGPDESPLDEWELVLHAATPHAIATSPARTVQPMTAGYERPGPSVSKNGRVPTKSARLPPL
jgi:hypothetical protein